jgi:large conductance mechanosensitive channel
MKETAKKQITGFFEFIREQGVVSLAVGFILGGAITKVVTSLVKDIINPILGIAIGSTEGLAKASLTIGTIQIMWGSFLSALIDFAIIAAVVYFGIKGLGLDKIDRKKKS